MHDIQLRHRFSKKVVSGTGASLIARWKFSENFFCCLLHSSPLSRCRIPVLARGCFLVLQFWWRKCANSSREVCNKSQWLWFDSPTRDLRTLRAGLTYLLFSAPRMVRSTEFWPSTTKLTRSRPIARRCSLRTNCSRPPTRLSFRNLTSQRRWMCILMEFHCSWPAQAPRAPFLALPDPHAPLWLISCRKTSHLACQDKTFHLMLRQSAHIEWTK